MACTILSLVQLVINLSKRFECAAQTSANSTEDGEVHDEPASILTEEAQVYSIPSKRPKKGLEKTTKASSHSDTFPSCEFPLGNSDRILEAKSAQLQICSKEAPRHSGSSEVSKMLLESKSSQSSTADNGALSYIKVVFQKSERIHSRTSEDVASLRTPLFSSENEPPDSTPSETDSDTLCSIKTIRFRNGEALSPSGGCKPAKIIRCGNVNSMELEAVVGGLKTSSAFDPLPEIRPSSGVPLEWREATPEARKGSSSSSDSSGRDSHRREWLSYSRWIQKGQRSIEEEEEEEKENRCRIKGKLSMNREDTLDMESIEDVFDSSTNLMLASMEEGDIFEETIDREDDSHSIDMREEGFSEEEVMMLQESVDQGYVDDFCSFEMAANEQPDNRPASDVDCGVDRSSAGESIELQTSVKHFSYRFGYDQLPAGTPEVGFKWSRGSSVSRSVGGAAESERGVTQEGTAGDCRRPQDDLDPLSECDLNDAPSRSPVGGWSTPPRRSGRSSVKRGYRPFLVQRQRCVQLEERPSSDETSEEEHYPNSSSPRTRSNRSFRLGSHSKEALLDEEPPLPREVPLVVIASPQGGTHTRPLQPIHRGDRCHSSLREPSPGRISRRNERSGGSLDTSLGRNQALLGFQLSFESERRLLSPQREMAFPRLLSPQREMAFPPSLTDNKENKDDSSRRLPPRPTLAPPPPQRGFRRSQSERVCGSPTVEMPARSESVRSTREQNAVAYNALWSPAPRLSCPSELQQHRDSKHSLFFRASFDVTEPLDVSHSSSTSNKERYSIWPPEEQKSRRPEDQKTRRAEDRKTRRPEDLRRQSSLDSGELEAILESRCQLERRRLELRNHSVVHSDSEESGCKVRYNDLGSLERVNEAVVDMMVEEVIIPVSLDNEQIRVQCRELWHLRSTLEEDPEEESDNGKMEVASSPEYTCVNPNLGSPEYTCVNPNLGSPEYTCVNPNPGSPEYTYLNQSPVDNVTTTTSHTTSFESSTSGRQGDIALPIPATTSNVPSTSYLSSEERRTSYKAILSQRLKHLDPSPRPAVSSENSFDSVETDWSSTTDLSRAEAITTSIESTTDSAAGDQTMPHRLHQMKADSGYKSLEVAAGGGQQILTEVSKTQLLQEELKGERIKSEARECPLKNRQWRSSERRSRLSSKKRRELLKEWQHVSLDGSLALESELNCADESSGKRSVLQRFLQANRPHTFLRPSQLRLLHRDYSIDEKSDRLFKEFNQTEVVSESENVTLPQRVRLPSGRRLQRRLEQADSSPRSHRRKLSPKDSIEEEDHLWGDDSAHHLQVEVPFALCEKR